VTNHALLQLCREWEWRQRERDTMLTTLAMHLRKLRRMCKMSRKRDDK